MSYTKEKNEISGFMQRLYNKGLTTCSGGNISLRISEKNMLITPSRTDKGNLSPEEICALDMDGNITISGINISMESKFHMAIYKKRPDINAIVHAHPVYATAFSLSDEKFDTSLTGETRALLGTPVIAGYKLMGTEELAAEVSSVCEHSNVIIMKHHGIITVGKTLFEAYDRMELCEVNAKMLYISRIMGFSARLSKNQLDEIDMLFE